MDQLKMHTPNQADENFRKLVALFPNAVTETIDENGQVVRAIDKDILMQEIATTVVDGREERYQFTWPDKKKAMLAANAPISATLRPVVEDSVGRDGTPGGFDSENLYIEGDNLDVLKLMQETYLGKVKMIYIDPPYNTGKDFVYEDDFAEEADAYLARSGQFDDQGNRLEQNTEANGRFHTDWLNMIYSRLKLAKNILSSDGVIFISIDDGELENLKKICDEIFGADNFINVISLNLKNVAGASGGGEDKRLKKNCEFILAYARCYEDLPLFNGPFVYTEMSELIQDYISEGKSWKYTSVLIHPGEKEYIGSTVDGDGNEIKVYRRVGFETMSINQLAKRDGVSLKDAYRKYGVNVFRTTNAQTSIRSRIIAFRKQNAIDDPLLSIEYVPKTGKNKGTVYEQFYKDSDCNLFVWLRDTSEVIDGELYKKDLQGTLWDFVGETKNLTHEGDVPFPNGKKPVKLLCQMISMITGENDIVVDFFSGSATTAHAVMKMNAEDGGNRRFIMVQLPEVCADDSEAKKAGYNTICEIGKERIRRAGRKIKEEAGLTAQNLDIGFRCLRLDSSNMQDVYYNPAAMTQDLLSLTTDNIKPDRTSEDLLFQVMLDLGVELSSTIKEATINGRKVFDVADGFLLACFDAGVDTATVTEIAKQQPYYAVFRDSSMANDSTATNFDQIFETYSKSTVRKVL